MAPRAWPVMPGPPAPPGAARRGAPLPRQRLGRVPAFDGLRALLVAAVLVYHLDGPHLRSAVGEVAVIVFFVLSGFLITTLLLEERARTGSISLRGFYARRARRLFPALALLLLVWLAMALLFGDHAWLTSVPGGGPGHPLAPGTALEGVGVAAAYLTNWFDAFPSLHLWVGYVPLGHLWTLAVEEQFYLVWAPLLLVLVRLRRPGRALAVLTAGTLALPFVLWDEGTHRLYFATDARSGALVLGAAAAYAWSRGRLRFLGTRLGAATALPLSALALVAAGLGFNGQLHEWSWAGGVTLAAVAGAVTVVSLAGRRDNWTSRWLSHPAAVWVGRRSYAAYLWGYVFNTWFRDLGPATTPVVVGATVLAAALSYRFVERPALGAGAGPAPRLSTSAAVSGEGVGVAASHGDRVRALVMLAGGD